MSILQSETNIGLIRKNNEDVSLAIRHPKDSKIVLLLVCDGMGGKEHGEVASSLLAKRIEKWFNTREVSTLNNLGRSDDQLRTVIHKVNEELIADFGENVSGTTLSLALVNKEATLIMNVGDSRIYIYKNRKLIQVSEDDSDVWYYYKYGAVRKDDLRYFYHNNIITACIGINEELCDIKSDIIDNDYNMILLFSDGVTDLVTDRKLKKVINNSKPNKILSNIIDEAVNKEQHLKVPMRLKMKKLSKYILPFHGRDNASGAIYIPKNLKK